MSRPPGLSGGTAGRSSIRVVAGVLRTGAGEVLLAQRPPGKEMAGKWELPGGKVREGESLETALARELEEELGVSVLGTRPLLQLAHEYPGRRVVLHTLEVRFRGEPVGREGQALQWLPPERMHELDLLEADGPIVTALTLPDRYLLTPPAITAPDALDSWLERALAAGVQLLQLRAPRASPAELEVLAALLARRLAGSPVRWLAGGDPARSIPLPRDHGAAGVHLPWRHAEAAGRVRASGLPQLVAVSCHDRAQLARAVRLGADFAVLGPLRQTPSHPGAPGLGWARFAEHVADLPMPVYAIGGLVDGDVEAARAAGAQGVAGIRGVGLARPQVQS